MDQPRRHRPALGLLIGVLLTATTTITGCGLVDRGDQAEVGPLVADALATTLKARARAVRAGDGEAFLATVDQDDPRLVRRQRTYFDNLAQLPIDRLRYRLDPATLIRAGDRWSALVEVRLQLAGFDQWPVVSREEVGFVPRGDGSAYVLSTERGEASAGRQPWDSRAILVRQRPGVLGIFDRASVGQADAVLASVAAGIDLVSAEVPYEWDRNVVVYALSGTSALSAIAGLPGGDPERLDGVSVPVGQRGDEAASTRLVLHPRMLSAPPAQRDRLIRHELTHIAVAGHDNRAPTWLSEGIAEYVSVQPVAEADRTLARPALIAASGASLTLPEGRSFNGADSEANYGVAWWACEAVVDLYGEPVLWQLLDRIGAAGDDDWDDVLEDTLQLSADDLAAEAGRRMLAAYGAAD